MNSTRPPAPDLSILVPCKNEEQHVCGTLDTIASAIIEAGCTCEIIVVDDGSSDNTSAVVERYMEQHPHLPITHRRNPKNLGLSRTFTDAAFASNGRYFRLVCGDNVEPKETLVTIMREMGRADIIVPFHKANPGSLLRIFISRLYTRLVNLFSGYHLHYYNGNSIFRRDHVMRWHSYAFGFGYQADLMTRLLDEGATYLEVPVDASRREKSGTATYLSPRNFVSTAHTLYEILRRRLNRIVFEDARK